MYVCCVQVCLLVEVMVKAFWLGGHSSRHPLGNRPAEQQWVTLWHTRHDWSVHAQHYMWVVWVWPSHKLGLGSGLVSCATYCVLFPVQLWQYSCHRVCHVTWVPDPHFQLNKKRELEGQIADLKSDLVRLDKQLDDMVANSRRQTNTVLWLGMSLHASVV